MKTLNDIQKLNQQQKTIFTFTNQITNNTNSAWLPRDIQSPFQNAVTQLSPQLSDHNIIHNTRGNLRSWSQSIEKQIISRDLVNKARIQNAQQSARQEKHFLGSVNGIQKINSPKSQANQTMSTHSSSRIDPKVKRKLSQMSKGNFLHFLLIQKVGHKDEKQFYDYLKKTYNFEIPQPQQEQSTKINKKDIKYLFTIDDDDETIKKTTQQIFKMNKFRHQKEVPLDKYVQDTYESQLRRFPKVRQKLEKSKPYNIALQ
ncbi:unnamed protein product [Paramecium primaurelia]|uniref:Uncharacterized protein n=1 Tax=Paramecium primaurelia TaxID=5886 RepID=A0A8S1MGB0_PARPR|nr:unnamed protein product [Paramecium primaurelia]